MFAVVETSLKRILPDTFGCQPTFCDIDVRDFASVTVHGLAASTYLPLETTRRKVKYLIEKNIAIQLSNGINVVPEFLASSSVSAFCEDARSAMKLAENNLFSVLDGGFSSLSEKNIGTLDFSIVSDLHLFRLLSSYFMKICDTTLSYFESPTAYIIYQTMLNLNIAHITHNRDATRRYGEINGAPPDDVRIPVSLSEIAKYSNIHYSTVRRYINALKEKGFCVEKAGGLIAPQSAVLSPEMTDSSLRFYSACVALFEAVSCSASAPSQ